MKKLLLIALLAFSFSANAALIGRLAATPGGTDYQAYYDDAADLTWLADANAAGTAMTWQAANNWAAGLTVDGVGGWRLPETTGTYCLSYDCTESEMGNLYYNVLGNSSGYLTNAGTFTNIIIGLYEGYWTSTEQDGIYAWDFRMTDGVQLYSGPTSLKYAWAVQSGDVSAVPIPAAAWLFGSGLLGLLAVARRKNTI